MRFKMKAYFIITSTIILSSLAITLHAEIEIKMDTTTIKGNTELPKIIYIVPWQKPQQFKSKEHRLVIHSLYGDLFDPILPRHQ